MGLHILLALPVIIVPFRRSIEGLEASLVTLWKLRDDRSQQEHSMQFSDSLQVLGAPLLQHTDQQCAPLRFASAPPRCHTFPAHVRVGYR